MPIAEKISDLPTGSALNSGDYIPIVDNSGTPTTKKITKQSLVASLGSATSGWNNLGSVPSTVTALGNRSYSLVFSAVDLTAFTSPGQRLRFTRTVAAPTQCTTLNGSTQAWSKATPAGMTFTNNFTLMAWVNLSSYQQAGIISRFSGTGYFLRTEVTGQLTIAGQTGATIDFATTYQSLLLNRWIHVAATLDMAGSVSTTYIDGILVPNTYTNSAATAITQAGNLEVGSYAGANFFPGRIAQAAVFSAVLSQATILSYLSQGLAGTETSLVSAYAFNGTATDLNTTNANNLTAVGGATATTASSPFGNQASGSISSTLEYGIVQKMVFSTNTTVTVQATEGNAIPTSGSISSVDYSSSAAPFGMPSSDSITRYTRSILNSSAPSLANASQDLRSCGLMQSISSYGNAVAQVRLDLNVTSTSDFEFRPEIWVNGVVYKQYSPSAAPGNASTRAFQRGFTWEVPLTDGINYISAGVTLTASTTPVMATGGGDLTVSIVKGVGTGN